MMGGSSDSTPILQLAHTPLVSLLLVPFQNDAMHYSADLEQFVFVVHHLFARESGDGVVLAQKNRLLGTNLLAHAAENAADHVDIEFLWVFFNLGEPISRWNFAGNDFDGARRTNEFTELTSHAAHTAIRITYKCWRSAIIFWQLRVPLFFRVLHGHFRPAEDHVFEMLDCDQ